MGSQASLCIKARLNIVQRLTQNNVVFSFIHPIDIYIENRIYIKGEFKESLGMNFFSPFHPKRELKVYKSCKCSQIICSRVH